MQKIIKNVDEKRGIVQITCIDERWYVRQIEDSKTKIPTLIFSPSITWIAGYYPKGIGFYKWLADKGWDEAEAIKVTAGDKGSKIHYAIADILEGKEVRIDSKYLNRSTGQEEELTLEEIDALVSFVKWRDEVKPITIAHDVIVWNKDFAGTIDHIYMLENEPNVAYVQDFKSGQYIWKEHELQISAYKNSKDELLIKLFEDLKIKEVRLELLQVGYKRNKNGWKSNMIEDKFDLFLNARRVWEEENKGVEPKQKDYPIIISSKYEHHD